MYKISKRKDGRWACKIPLPNGKRKYLYGKTRKEVKEKVEKLLSELNTGTFLEKNSATLDEWVITWLENYLINIKESTKDVYNKTYRNYIQSEFGNKKLQKITHNQIQIHITNLSKNGLSAKTVKNIHGVFHRIFRDALKADLILSNPAENIILPTYMKKEINPLNEDEIKKFFELTKNHTYSDVYEFLILTGLRINECLGLTVDRYNPKDRTILIDRQIEPKPFLNFVSPKNNKSRTLYLCDRAIEIIESRLKRTELERVDNPFYNEHDLIFFGRYRHYSSHTIYNNIRKIGKLVRKENVRLHDLRHTYATLSLKAGVDIKTVQQNLGHSTASFTLQQYAHSTDHMQKKASEKIQNVLLNLNK